MPSPTDPTSELFMVEILATDWTGSARWYVEVLGLQPILEDRQGRFLLLEAGAGRLALKEGASPADRGSVRLIFRVEEIDSTRNRLIGLGIDVSPIIESAEGYREIRLLDPDGTPIRLFAWAVAPEVPKHLP